jgi:hypothetical protein
MFPDWPANPFGYALLLPNEAFSKSRALSPLTARAAPGAYQAGSTALLSLVRTNSRTSTWIDVCSREWGVQPPSQSVDTACASRRSAAVAPRRLEQLTRGRNGHP